jgi:chromosome segregation ATPase
LAETCAVVRDLQTKIGHAELAKNEAVDALRRERDSAGQSRSESEALEARLQEARERAEAAEDALNECQDQLSGERHARKAAEKALRAAEAARDAAEQLVRALSEEEPGPQRTARPAAEQSACQPAYAETRRSEPSRRGRAVAEPEVAAVSARRQRPVEPPTPEGEPEPVKWWLNTKATPKRR